MTGAQAVDVLEQREFQAEGLEGELDKVLQQHKGKPKTAAQEIVKRFAEKLGVVTAADRDELVDTLSQALSQGSKEVDLIGLLKKLRDAHAGIDVYTAIFGKQHGQKMAALIRPHTTRRMPASRTRRQAWPRSSARSKCTGRLAHGTS